MSPGRPDISVNVDVTNPGQFFACCGLLELADRLWPGAAVAGKFSPPSFERARFQISCNHPISLNAIIGALLNCERKGVDPYRPIVGSDGKPVKDARKTKPVAFGEPISLRLSWWLDEIEGRQTAFKTWSAHKTGEGLVGEMAQAIHGEEITEQNVLQWRVGMTSRLGLDIRSSWNTLDAGFSPNDQKLSVDTYPVTEILAAVGLEAFRPESSNDGFSYAIWSAPLPTVVARAAASGTINIPGKTCYRFEVDTRGKFRFFTKAKLLERSTRG